MTEPRLSVSAGGGGTRNFLATRHWEAWRRTGSGSDLGDEGCCVGDGARSRAASAAARGSLSGGDGIESVFCAARGSIHSIDDLAWRRHARKSAVCAGGGATRRWLEGAVRGCWA